MRIPVSTAKSVANKHDLKQCLLIGWDGEQVHIVTYGKTIADCAQAAKAREFWKGHIREFSFKGDVPPNSSSSEQDALREALVEARRLIENYARHTACKWISTGDPDQARCECGLLENKRAAMANIDAALTTSSKGQDHE
jgi:hypothetical protein